MEAIKVLSSNKFYTAEMKQNRFYIQLLLGVLGNFVCVCGGMVFLLYFLNSYIFHFKTVFLLVIIFIARKYFTTEMQPR